MDRRAAHESLHDAWSLSSPSPSPSPSLSVSVSLSVCVCTRARAAGVMCVYMCVSHLAEAALWGGGIVGPILGSSVAKIVGLRDTFLFAVIMIVSLTLSLPLSLPLSPPPPPSPSSLPCSLSLSLTVRVRVRRHSALCCCCASTLRRCETMSARRSHGQQKLHPRGLQLRGVLAGLAADTCSDCLFPSLSSLPRSLSQSGAARIHCQR